MSYRGKGLYRRQRTVERTDGCKEVENTEEIGVVEVAEGRREDVGPSRTHGRRRRSRWP